MRMISPEECEDGLGDAKQFYDKKTHVSSINRNKLSCMGSFINDVVQKTDF